MAFTREFLRKTAKESGVDLPKELEDALIQEHLSVRDAYAGEQVKTALENNKPEPAPKVEDTEEYKILKQQFDQYKVDQQNKEISAARGNAAKEILKAAGLSGKALEVTAAIYKKDTLELDESGKAKDFDNLVSAAKTEYAEMIPKSGYTPPVGVSIKTFTPDDIRKMTPAEINKNFDAIKASLKGEK